MIEQLTPKQRARLESRTREQRIEGMRDGFLVFAGYMQSREAKNATKRYRLWRRSHKEVRVWIATACQNKSMSSRVALILLNDTMSLEKPT